MLKNPMVIHERWLAESYIEDWGEDKFEIINAEIVIQTAEELQELASKKEPY